MSTDFNIKPVGAPVAAPIVHPMSEAAQNAVATELPGEPERRGVGMRARAPIPYSDAVHVSISNAIRLEPGGDRSRRWIDRLSGRRQPDEPGGQAVSRGSVLRRRAYFHALDLTKDAPTRLRATDRRA